MLVYVLNHHGKPMMPCSPARARRLLKDGKARVVRRDPFTIKLLFGSSGYKQDVVAGMDTGSKTIGSAAIANGKVVYQAEVTLRDDVSRQNEATSDVSPHQARPQDPLSQATVEQPGVPACRPPARTLDPLQGREPSARARLRRTDSARATLEARTGVLRHPQDREPRRPRHRLPRGGQKDFYNVKAYVLHRDGYKCQSGRQGKHSPKLHVHHKVFRSQGGSDEPSNLVTLCATCHDDLHAGTFNLKAKRSRTRHATEVGIVKGAIAGTGWAFSPTFGYETKWKREQCLGWPKSHAADAVAICCEDGAVVTPNPTVVRKRHVAKGDYQQTSGTRSEQRIPTGKLFGLRKFDLVATPNSVGFVKGKRSTGYFAIAGLDGTPINNSTRAASCVRLTARSTTLARSG